MNIEHIRIGMVLFSAHFDEEQGSITVYRGTVVDLSMDGEEVTLLCDGISQAHPPLKHAAAAVMVSETVIDALDALYVLLLSKVRMISEASRKTEWLFRFAQLNKGDVRCNAPIPIRGQEREDHEAMEELVQRLVAQKMAESPPMFQVKDPRVDETVSIKTSKEEVEEGGEQ